MVEVSLITKECKIIQRVVLLCTAFLLLIFLLFLFVKYSYGMLSLVFIDVVSTVLLNLFIGKIYEIRIEGDEIVTENIWKKVHYPVGEIMDVRLVHFAISYPFNPYFKLVLRNKREFVAIIPDRMKYYLSRGGIDRYIKEIKDKLMVMSLNR
ncbi:MAG TPA: hypothetical protein VGM30_12655 [Puia sp.]|jgi:hypothetical protein